MLIFVIDQIAVQKYNFCNNFYLWHQVTIFISCDYLFKTSQQSLSFWCDNFQHNPGFQLKGYPVGNLVDVGFFYNKLEIANSLCIICLCVRFFMPLPAILSLSNFLILTREGIPIGPILNTGQIFYLVLLGSLCRCFQVVVYLRQHHCFVQIICWFFNFWTYYLCISVFASFFPLFFITPECR